MSNDLGSKMKSAVADAVDDVFDVHRQEDLQRTISDFVRQGDIMDLARAIRDGDRDGATIALDLVARGSVALTEWVAQGRAS